jgi:hypothetical protein
VLFADAGLHPVGMRRSVERHPTTRPCIPSGLHPHYGMQDERGADILPSVAILTDCRPASAIAIVIAIACVETHAVRMFDFVINSRHDLLVQKKFEVLFARRT